MRVIFSCTLIKFDQYDNRSSYNKWGYASTNTYLSASDQELVSGFRFIMEIQDCSLSYLIYSWPSAHEPVYSTDVLMHAPHSTSSPSLDAYLALRNDPLCPLSRPSIPPLICTPELDHSKVVIEHSRAIFTLRLYGQISDLSQISWDMNLQPDETVRFLLNNFCSPFMTFIYLQITPNSLSSFHPRFSLRIPGEDIQTITYGHTAMRLQVEHILKSINEVNALLPSLSPDSTFFFFIWNELFKFYYSDSLIEIEYPIIPSTLDSDEWLFIFDGPPVFEPFSDHSSVFRVGTTAIPSSQGPLIFAMIRSVYSYPTQISPSPLRNGLIHFAIFPRLKMLKTSS